MKKLLAILIACTVFAGCNWTVVPTSRPVSDRDRQQRQKAEKEQAERERERQESQRIEEERQRELRRQEDAQRERDKKLAEEAQEELVRKAKERADAEAERLEKVALAKKEFEKEFAKFLEVYKNNELLNPWAAKEAIQWKNEVDDAFVPVKLMLPYQATNSEEFKAKRQALNAVQKRYKDVFVKKNTYIPSPAKDNQEKLAEIDEAINFETKNKEKIAEYREQKTQYEKAEDEFYDDLSKAVTKQELRSKEDKLLVRRDDGYWFYTGPYSSTSFNENFNVDPFDSKSSDFWKKNLAPKRDKKSNLSADIQNTLANLKIVEGFVSWEAFIRSRDLAAEKERLLEDAAKYKAIQEAFDKAVADFKAYLESKL